MQFKMTIGFFPSSGFEAKFPVEIAAQLGLKDGGAFPICCGQRIQTAVARVLETGDAMLSLSQCLGEQLLVPPGVTINLRREPGGEVRLGPAVGVFVNQRQIAKFEKGLVPGSSSSIENANVSEKLDCLLFFFSLSGIDYPGNRIKGYYFSAGSCHSGWLPFPDVIYDRGVNFLPDQRAQVEHFRKTVYDAKIPRVNSVDAFGKWRTYQALSKCPEVAGILPPTVVLRSLEDVRVMLAAFPAVILKGEYGRRGKQIMLLTKKEKGYRIVSCKGSLVVNSWKDARIQVEKFIRKKSFVVQKAVSLLNVDGRNMDFRVLIAKDGRGQWTVAYNLARIARSGMPFTNGALGAEGMGAIEALRFAGYSDQVAHLLVWKARQLSLQVGCCLEQSFGPLGVAGIDIGLDTEGKFWLFEVNSKPEKPPRLGNHTRLHYVRPLQYSMFLAGFSV